MSSSSTQAWKGINVLRWILIKSVTMMMTMAMVVGCDDDTESDDDDDDEDDDDNYNRGGHLNYEIT